mgnify:CR=1 FL=1
MATQSIQSTPSIFSVMSQLANEYGAINLAQGFPNFPIDQALRDAVSEAAQGEAHQYAPYQGQLTLRKAIKDLIEQNNSFPITTDEILITAGATQAIFTTVQALVSAGRENDYGNARRVVSGLDSARTSMTLAVLELRANIRVGGRDVYAATVGGMKMTEPAADLALALAVASAAKGLALPSDLVAIGEVGLAGEIRKVSGVNRRLQEAYRLGFKRALVPTGSDTKIDGMEIVEVSRLDAALKRVKITGE